MNKRKIFTTLATLTLCVSLVSSAIARGPAFRAKVPLGLSPQWVWATMFAAELKSEGYSVVPPSTVQAALRRDHIKTQGKTPSQLAKDIGKATHCNLSLSGDVDPKSSAKGPTKVTMHVSLIDTSTGEIVWFGSATRSVSVGGFGGGVDDNRMTKALQPLVHDLVKKMEPKLDQAIKSISAKHT